MKRARESNPIHLNVRTAFQADPITIKVYSLIAEEVRLELTRVLPPTVFKTATHRPTWFTLPFIICREQGTRILTE